MTNGWNLPKKITNSEVGSSDVPIRGTNRTATAKNKKTNLDLIQIFLRVVIKGFEGIMDSG
jgi:hypothetical protein